MLLPTTLTVVSLLWGSGNHDTATVSLTTVTITTSNPPPECTGCVVYQNVDMGIHGTRVSTGDSPPGTIEDYPLANVGTMIYDDSGFLSNTALVNINAGAFEVVGSALISPTPYYYFSRHTVWSRVLSNNICSLVNAEPPANLSIMSIPGAWSDLANVNNGVQERFLIYRSMNGIPTPICTQQNQDVFSTDSLSAPSTGISNAGGSIFDNPDYGGQGLSQSARIIIGVSAVAVCILVLSTLFYFIMKKRQKVAAAASQEDKMHTAEIDGKTKSELDSQALILETDGRSRGELDSHAIIAETDGMMRQELRGEVPMYELPADMSKQQGQTR